MASVTACNRATDELLDEMVRVIVREIDPERIILFGSRARGDARPDSDVDLLIVRECGAEPRQPRYEETGRLYRLLAQFQVFCSIRRRMC